jgi:hypothetical protein
MLALAGTSMGSLIKSKDQEIDDGLNRLFRTRNTGMRGDYGELRIFPPVSASD